MKKLLSLLLVGTLAAATQAVTIDWSKSGAITSTTTGTCHYWGGRVFAVTASFTFSGSVIAGDIIKVGRANEGSTTYEGKNYATVGVTNQGGTNYLSIAAYGGKGSEVKTVSSIVVEADKEITFSLVASRADPNTFTLYVNGKKDSVAVVELSNAMDTPTKAIWVYGSNSLTVEDVSVYSADAGENIYTLAQKNSVPEPTVMALLALGVAGLALRRKA
ncbi:MAG: PEP-CTERM sorting domain-containing protein [Lentisphaeraceae bacterium]|nr:PEP-CTERM sorting domain-containing protein [Lentisphaeraceae bacterium]